MSERGGLDPEPVQEAWTGWSVSTCEATKQGRVQDSRRNKLTIYLFISFSLLIILNSVRDGISARNRV